MPEAWMPHKTSLRDILFILFSKKNVFLGIWVLVVTATVLVAFSADPVYEASAKILVKPFVDPLLHYDSPPGILRPSPVSPQDINSEIDVILSDEVLRKVVQEIEALDEGVGREGIVTKVIDFTLKTLKRGMVAVGLSVAADPMDRAMSALRQRLVVAPITMSNMIQITMTGKDPKRLADSINMLVDHSIDRHIQVHQSEEGLGFFTNQAQLYGDRLKTAEEDLRKFHHEGSVGDIGVQREGNIKLMEILKQSLAEIHGRISEYEVRLERSHKDPEALTQELRDNSVLIEYFKSLLPLMVELERIAQLYPDKSVEYQDTSKQVEEIKKRIEGQQKRILAGSEIDLGALKRHEQALSAQIDRLEQENVDLTEKEIQFKRLSRDFRQAEKNYLLYMDKTEEARIQKQKEASRVANISVASWAYPPSIPIFPRKTFMLVISIMAGFIMGMAGAFVAYYMDHTIKTPEEMMAYADIPAISAIELMHVAPPARRTHGS
jgi:uncharacterized protein involved in exopolysaccharide biosynthesis